MKAWKGWGIIILALAGLIASFSYSQKLRNAALENVKPSEKRFAAEYPAMGTMVNVVIYSLDRETAENGFAIVRTAFDEVSKHCNLFDKESELSKLNAAAGRNDFVCSPLLWEILEKSAGAYRDSGGLFDITGKPLMDLWGFYRKREALPDEAERKAAREKVGFAKLVMNPAKHTVRFGNPESALDLGGVAKGYAVDLAAERLLAAGIKNAIVDLGGNIRCLGTPPGRNGFTIGVKNPFNPKKMLRETKLLCNSSVSTSGDYERFVEIGGKQYGHIMNPLTGLPAAGGFAVTVFAPTAAEADLWSTSVFLGGETLAKELTAKYPELEIWIYDKNYNKVIKGSRADEPVKEGGKKEK